MSSSYADHDRRRVNAWRLWGVGAVAAVLAGLLAKSGILVAQRFLLLPLFAPQGYGVWRDAAATAYVLGAGLIALAATLLLRVLLATTPRAMLFFGWIMTALTFFAVVVPLTLHRSNEMLAACVVNLFIGLIVTSLLAGAARWALTRGGRAPRPAWR
ncbi:hypothetical protein OG539_19630 [Actinacidiphila glaucinigra]|uniref:hypothetical protein n=1 Tax=Actinacidiphila glaucinigra TaxID=235986 RepID=UPI002DDC2439|nr:hypothetical protein [Actinacidiphila glaucinigra]WSD61594.1 hypothetical protein OIE69_23160 [Actinacidiphila glaucinigra]